ncbi:MULTISPECIES: hypothetical protein [unclassified Pseudarthrobacter]|uniref:hypothetical protein n=1 Tax=unclassified Pseudarthrobacter TaxID=2647000 RepID=UPI003077ACAC
MSAGSHQMRSAASPLDGTTDPTARSSWPRSNLHQSRNYSSYLALQLKARMEGLETPVYELQPSHHTR